MISTAETFTETSRYIERIEEISRDSLNRFIRPGENWVEAIEYVLEAAVAEASSEASTSQKSRDLSLVWSNSTAALDTMPFLSPSSTEFRDVSALDVEEEIDSLFHSARELTFEDGMDNQFSRAITNSILIYKSRAIQAIINGIVRGSWSNEVIGEALRLIGAIVDPMTHQLRLWLLAWCLNSVSPLVRDGASLGLSEMNDPSAIPYLQAAIDREQGSALRQDLIQVLEYLQSEQ